ncbi:MFS transporter [Myxococcota bacterium]|nr:MFS transporter [Myxococcota bacterium]
MNDPVRDIPELIEGSSEADPNRGHDPQATTFHGWRVVLLGLLANAFGTGLIGAYSFMVSPLIEEFGATPGQLGLGMSIVIFSMAVLGPILGPLFDRGLLRITMLLGVALMLSGLLLLSRGSELWQLAICLVIASMGMSMYGFLPTQVMIVNWFIRKRGTALAIAAAGTSLAGFVIPPTTAWLIETSGWRDAIVWLAVGAAVIAAPVISTFAVRRPEDVGQHPDGDPSSTALSENESLASATPLRTLMQEPNFWLIGVGIALALCVPVASGVFIVRHLEEIGIPRTQAALILPVMAVCSLLGKLCVGFLADRSDRRLLAVATLVSHVVGLCILATGSSLETMFAAAIPLGLGGGGFMPIPGILQGACFGRLVIGRVSGFHSFIGLPFLLVAAPLVGVAASATGSFMMPFLVMGAIQLAAAGLLSFIRIPKVEPSTAPASGGV